MFLARSEDDFESLSAIEDRNGLNNSYKAESSDKIIKHAKKNVVFNPHVYIANNSANICTFDINGCKSYSDYSFDNVTYFNSYNDDGYKCVYQCRIDEDDIVKMKNDVIQRAKGLAALQRLNTVDYEYGTWL